MQGREQRQQHAHAPRRARASAFTNSFVNTIICEIAVLKAKPSTSSVTFLIVSCATRGVARREFDFDRDWR